MTVPMHVTAFPTSVRVGGLAKSELLHSLRGRRVCFNEAAEKLFQDPRFTPKSRIETVQIAFRSVGSLGLRNGATYERLIARAAESGLTECPLELGPHLRLQYWNQPDAGGGLATPGKAPAGSITVASQWLDDSDDTPKGFYLLRSRGARWLRAYWTSSDYVWAVDDVMVFSLGSG